MQKQINPKQRMHHNIMHATVFMFTISYMLSSVPEILKVWSKFQNKWHKLWLWQTFHSRWKTNHFLIFRFKFQITPKKFNKKSAWSIVYLHAQKENMNLANCPQTPLWPWKWSRSSQWQLKLLQSPETWHCQFTVSYISTCQIHAFCFLFIIRFFLTCPCKKYNHNHTN